MWRIALLHAFEFAVTLPDCPLVLAGAVPDLTAIDAAAVAADDATGETARAGPR